MWDVRCNTTIADYFDANHPHWDAGRSREIGLYDAGEFNFLPTSTSRRSSFVIVLNKNAIDPTIMNNSFEVNSNGNSPLFENGNMSRGHEYPTHRAIPIGTPANAIEKIIVDTRFVNEYDIKLLKQKIEQLGLDISLYDLNGNKI